jgi:probable H4MPT-linked C1 transfer pathway protein
MSELAANAAPVIGWDVGGANLKVARVDSDRSSIRVVERPFAIWREPQRLPEWLANLADLLGRTDTMAVTMTAELADCFATKREGVSFVLESFRTAFPDIEPSIYGVDGRFRSVEAAREQPFDVAAANWMATAALVARHHASALVLDVGSTTTDIIPIVDGRVAVCGRTDPARLQSGELVYTGALRTPICSIVRSVPLGGRRCRVAAEHFAIAADAHLWLGSIDEHDYTCETADGRGRSRFEAGARLARVVCGDAELLNTDDVSAIARRVAEAQVGQIAGGVRQVLKRLGATAPKVAILAGQGTFLARAAVRRFGLEIRDLGQDIGSDAARIGPAAAVAWLLADELDRTGS